MRHLTLKLSAVAILAGCATANFTGSRIPAANASAGTPPITWIAGVNVSGSSIPELADSIRFAVDAAVSLPDRAHIEIDRFGSKTENVYSGPRPDFDVEFHRVLDPRLRAVVGIDKTLVDVFIAHVEAKVDAAPGPVVIAILGDGYAEGVGATGHRAIRAAAERLAKNPAVLAFYIVGSRPEAREGIVNDFGAFGAKLRFLEFTDDPGSAAGGAE